MKKLKVTAIFLLLVPLAGSCIYFNSMYNARRLYREAEEMRLESKDGVPSRAVKEKYKEVIVKCSRILQENPESSWVDDSIFLMGQALIRQEDYNKGIRKFLELTTNFPESEYVPRALYWLAMANLMKEEYNQALLYTDRFLNGFPKHELRHDVLFLAGDLNLELDKDQDALTYYAKVAEESDDSDIVDQSVLKSARLYYRFKDWENAAQSYSSLLRKGISWDMRFDITLALGDCYTKTGRCQEAKELLDEILPDVPKIQDKGPVMLGQAASYMCMDSLDAAIAVYKEISTKFPRSNFSAEAFYRLGLIYHERMDSLALAQGVFEKVSVESASSEYAALAMQKSTSMKKLIELEKSSGEGASEEQLARKRFSSAEIKLTKLGELKSAIANYQAVIDSFPASSYAPKAAYALAWIYKKERKDSLRAQQAWKDLVIRYPRSRQASGAMAELLAAGGSGENQYLQAYIDSAMADTVAAAEEMRLARERAAADSLQMAARTVPAQPDRRRPPQPPSRDEVLRETRYTLRGGFNMALLGQLRRERFDRLRRTLWGGNTTSAAPVKK